VSGPEASPRPYFDDDAYDTVRVPLMYWWIEQMKG
jgi:hypothetical protein